MSNKRCHHGDDAPRNNRGQCLTCGRERRNRWEESRKSDPEQYAKLLADQRRYCAAFRSKNREAYNASARISNRERYRRKKIIATGYATSQAAELLALEMRDLLARAPELARIYQTPDLAPVRTDSGYRWPRVAVDNVRAVMFGAARSNPSSHTGRFK